MSDELLDYYNRELAYFRKMAEGFSNKHPKIAGRLRLGERIEDPHVSRLIESFAYLNARVRLKVEDEFPELCEAILSVLYPEYLAPFPSCAVVQFSLPESQFELTTGHRVEKGAALVTDEVDGEPCRFQSCYQVDIFPVRLEAAGVMTPPFNVPPNRFSNEAKAVVRLELKTFVDRVKIKQMSMDKLRVFLDGETRYVYDLYELILNNAMGVVLASSDRDLNPVSLSPDVLKPVGFETGEALIPYSAKSRMGYHLLTEFFAFPQKFMFFDIEGLDVIHRSKAGDESSMVVYIFLDEIYQNVENLPESTFQLGATPAINLFDVRCEPIRVSATKSEFRVVPDARRPLGNEIFGIQQVTASNQDRRMAEVYPFYSASHLSDESNPCFWFARRRTTEIVADQFNAAEDLGTDLYLSLVGLDGKNNASSFEQWHVDVKATCFNRDYPNRLPVNAGIRRESGSSLVQAKTLVNPTKTVRANLRDESYWRLISHLSLNHISLLKNESNTESLKEIVRLYNLADHRVGNVMLDGLVNVHAKRVVSRINSNLNTGFCKGTEVELTLNEDKFSGGGHYLFGAVLDRFLALYSSINSFTKTVLRTQQRETILCRWPARVGDSYDV